MFSEWFLIKPKLSGKLLYGVEVEGIKDPNGASALASVLSRRIETVKQLILFVAYYEHRYSSITN